MSPQTGFFFYSRLDDMGGILGLDTAIHIFGIHCFLRLAEKIEKIVELK